MGFDSNTVDYLGMKLYSQFPSVLAELFSNVYDAESKNVNININQEERGKMKNCRFG